MSEIAIHTQNLGKSYDGTLYALHSLSLEIPAGTVFGFLGPNGAGKTTTVKLLTGLLKPTEGSCAVLGLSPVQKPSEVHRLCGVVTETARMYARMTGMRNLLFFGQAYGLERRDCRERAEELLKRMDLWDARDRQLSAYSTGMAQRLSVARAMIGRPKLLFLDEPTSGLDPESALAVNSMIAFLARQEGVTIFLCTHQLRYAQDLCSSYGIIHKGQLLACGDLPSLSREVGLPLHAQFRLKEGKPPEGLERMDGGWWRAELESEEDMPALLGRIVSAGNSVYEARIARPTLEDVYFKFVELKGV